MVAATKSLRPSNVRLSFALCRKAAAQGRALLQASQLENLQRRLMLGVHPVVEICSSLWTRMPLQAISFLTAQHITCPQCASLLVASTRPTSSGQIGSPPRPMLVKSQCSACHMPCNSVMLMTAGNAITMTRVRTMPGASQTPRWAIRSIISLALMGLVAIAIAANVHWK